MIPTSRKRLLLAAVWAATLVIGCAPPDAGREERLAGAYLRLLAAEDARPDAGSDLITIIEATRSSVVFLRRTAVRALGRLEQPVLVDEIAPFLNDPVASVRAEAANALAQAVHGRDDDLILDALLERVAIEPDSLVLAALARSLGRSSTSTPARARASAVLIELSVTPTGDAPLATLVGVTLGFESLVRRARGQGLSRNAAARLIELAGYGAGEYLSEDVARVRSLALSALGQARRLDRGLLDQAIQDREVSVRLVATRHLDAVPPGQRTELIRRILTERSLPVALEALRRIALEPRDRPYCVYLLGFAAPNIPAALRVTALDALSRPCPQIEEQRRTLALVASGIDSVSFDGWHAPAHALVSLAQLSPDDAAELLPRFVSASDPFVRAYAARAARALRDAEVLRALTSDPVANVRTAAIEGLFALEGHGIDDVLLAQLDGDDPQLLLTTARLLEGSPRGLDAAASVLAAFRRISEAERETWRDSRRALLARVGELGDASLSESLVPFLADYDAVVADDTAEILETWSGRAHTATPRPRPLEPLPTTAELLAMTDATVVLHMRAGGSVVIELLPYVSTTNVYRFVRLAASGYLDGLTFHRWAPNFVLQGGSPGANEYQGDGPFTRDEVGLQPHWRGTVGVSTRGRDTGDGQIFINLMDNVRLDHDYTIIGTVIEGMEIVETLLEGAIIDRAEVRRSGATED